MSDIFFIVKSGKKTVGNNLPIFFSLEKEKFFERRSNSKLFLQHKLNLNLSLNKKVFNF